MNYTPNPIDTSHVQLSADILELTEKLAEHTHEIWAQQRFSDGWTYGPERDDANKKHPDLIPYAGLPEKEKEYDRRAALHTLKAVLALGYRVERE